MSRRRSVFGITVLAALALSALGAANASATGGTAYTCVKDAPNGKFSGAHCLEGAGEYKHVAITNKTTTTVTNANTAEGTTAARSAALKGSLSGVETEITCGEIHGEGSLENKVTGGEEMYTHIEGKLHFTKCEVKKPAGKGCKVNNETITTNQLTGTSEGQAGGALKITPQEGTTFSETKLEGCSIPALNNTFPITGSLKGVVTGATVNLTHAEATAQNTLKFGGVKAGLDGALTFKGHEKDGEETNPITVTK